MDGIWARSGRALFEFTLGNIRDCVDPSRVYFDDFVIIFSVARVGGET